MLTLLIFVVIILCYTIFVINPIVANATRATILSQSSLAVSEAVYDVLEEQNLGYEDLVSVAYGQDGSIELISVDTVTLNTIVRLMYYRVQNSLDAMNEKGIDIAIGTFSGIPALTGLGFKINVKLATIGTITAYFSSSFSSAGINQTNHVISVNFSTSVSLLLPIYTSTVETSTELLICNGIIVGDVPNVYLDTGTITYVEG